MSDREKRLERALEFYADPETYHGVSFIMDPPGGGWDEDFSDDHGHPDYDRPMPGKLAREALDDDGAGGAHEHRWNEKEGGGYMCADCGTDLDNTPPGNDARGEALEEIANAVDDVATDLRFMTEVQIRDQLRGIAETARRKALTAPPTVPEDIVESMRWLAERYVANFGHRGQFISCITPANDHESPYYQHWDKVRRYFENYCALAQHSEPGRECGWSLDDEGCYQTDCGTEFVSPDFLTLEEMPSMKYCANCGRRIRDDSPAPDADERE